MSPIIKMGLHSTKGSLGTTLLKFSCFSFVLLLFFFPFFLPFFFLVETCKVGWGRMSEGTKEVHK
jgi:hypothetical protein